MTTPSRDPRRQLAGGYRIDLFADQDAVSGADVVKLWEREGGLSSTEAERRVAEILLVATDRQRQLVGVSTAYLRLNDQLRAVLWYVRVFVSPAHRQLELARSLALTGRDHLVQRFVSGEDRRGIGIIYEVESEVLRRHLPQARWPQTHFMFIGENDRGYHVRVYYFPGATAPDPDHGSA